jgi:hypothetical protein
MSSLAGIKPHMEVIGADGVKVGTVIAITGDRIQLSRADAGMGHHEGHHHYVPAALVAGLEDGRVRLAAAAAVAVLDEEEEDGSSIN